MGKTGQMGKSGSKCIHHPKFVLSNKSNHHSKHTTLVTMFIAIFMNLGKKS